MAKSYYDLLEVAPTASAGEIKQAFRREIAKYHPDKVQHLGREFQEIAAVKAAELTRAYKTLSDESLRADYDAGLTSETGWSVESAPPAPSGPTSTSHQRPFRQPELEPESSPRGSHGFTQDRVGVSDLVRKAAVVRFRQALDAEFGRCDEIAAQGFEIACAPPKGRFWSKLPPRVLARFVANVDATAVADGWASASRVKRDDQRDLCVFVMGPAVAPAAELARAIAEQRRKPVPAGGKVILIPVNTRSWQAHIPNDAPPLVKSLITRLKSA